ncbi:MAG: peptidase M14 [Gemmatimonadaceae bacterium]|nr:peptidase M14 [Gemmatimonadaceae bacterium]NUQ92930.1 peptidase M14 [Gemmatimonadaceae bacterium]NUR19581.1 peptidase M14 [Gemmatimonadaceae bacterium]
MKKSSVVLAASLLLSTAALRAQVPTPSAATGLDVGADRVLADWGQITGYFATLARSSPAVRVDTLGRTTEGRPFIVATISTPANMRQLDAIRATQAMLADPRRLSAADEARAVAGQPAVLVISCNIHATEIGASQMAMELAHRLATNDTLQGYLRDVVVLLVPSMNPDGQQMVTEWYRKGVGTQWEGGPLPWVYHHYVGHDNNRDWYMITQAETKLVSRMLYQRWFPEIFYDVHQQGSNGMRITVPPHVDPIDPYVDPLIVRGINQIGAKMSWELESRGKSGVGDGATYDLWWHGGARSAPTRHNMIGLLTEAASARIATPLTLKPEDLQGHSRGLPRYERRVNFPNPWPGGTWRLRDIMDYELIAAEALVKLASDQRAEYVRNYVALGRKAIEAGSHAPYAYRVSAGRDPEASRRLIEALRWGGVEMGTAAGSSDIFIPLAQPYRAHVMDLFDIQRFPKMERYPGGPVERPYDVAGWTLPLQMGVTVTAIDTALTARLTPMTAMSPEFPSSACAAPGAGRYVALDASDTRSYGLVASALGAGREVRVSGSGRDARFVTAATGSAARGCAPRRVSSLPAGARLTRMPRIGLYRSWTGSIDEGWTRFLLDQERIPYVSVTDSMVKAGKLRDLYDVILVPDMSFREIRDGMPASQVPPQYAGGLGDAGVAELAAFTRAGGTLVLLDRASELATTALQLPVTRITVPRQDDEGAQGAGASLYAPGSILRVLVDPSSHVARGMADSAAVYFTNSVTFDVPAGSAAQVIARYPAQESDILLSGYLQGGSAIAGKAAAVEVPVGRGRVVMFGFRVQYRGQSYGTFKMLFNALLGEGDSTTRR